MATVQTFTDSFRLELVKAGHDLSTDVLMLALYTNAATFSTGTTAYTTTSEASGSGYTAGGQVVSLQAGYPQIVSNRAEVRFSNVQWTGSTITARYALMYNASKSNASVMVLDFGGDQSSSSQIFQVNLDDGVNAMISI